jgi:hypothetical protein
MNPNILGGDGDLVFPWVRYWTPLNKPIQLGASVFWGGDSDGFLADPEDGFIGAEANKHLLTTERLLKPRAGCYVLCGDPGMGKSRALDAALKAQTNPHQLHLEFRDIPTWEQFYRQTKESKIWGEWVAGSHLITLTVDGVDEGLIKIDGFVGALAGMLKTEPVSRLQLVLACRSLEWPQSEGQRLLALWGGAQKSPVSSASGIYELCPLRERDVKLAAEHALGSKKGINSGAGFLRELKRHRLIGLGSRPLTLKMLLSEFASGAGKFPLSHRELYRRCTRTLVRERDAGRLTRLRNKNIPRLTASEQQRLRVAGRIATLLLLSGRSSIATAEVVNPMDCDLKVDEIAQGRDWLGEIPFEVTPILVDAALETPLFWPKAEGRVGFYHQTFAESLAAEYLGHMPFPQVRSLLFKRDGHGEHVHPQLGELAAWMACESEPLLAHLLEHDPEVLLRSDVSGIRDHHKAALVDAVLRKARAEELFDGAGLSRFFHTLRHPGLAKQLRLTFHDRSANHVARRLALGIAEACRLEEMLRDAVRCLRDPSDDSMHRVAAAALDELASPQTALRLAPLLRRPDMTESKRLHILHALLKHRVWSLSDALPYVAAALSRDSSSGYILAQHATSDDAEMLLRYCLKWRGCFDSISRFRPLVRAAHRFGVARINEQKIRLLLARVWWKARRQHQHDNFCRADRLDDDDATPLPELLKRDAALRRRFIADLVLAAKDHPGDRKWNIVELVHMEDFETMLERASIGSKWRRKIYAQVVTQCFWQAENATRSGQLIEALMHSAELREAFPWMRLWIIGADDSLAAAKSHYEAEKWRHDLQVRRTKKQKPTPESIWRRDLKNLTLRQPATHWITLAYNLSYIGDDGRADDDERRDITTSPGWKYHDDSARQRILRGARRLILEVPGNPQHRMGGQSEFDELAYKALFLLRSEIERDPALADAVRRHWLPTIYDEFSNADAHHLEMIALGYRIDADHMRLLLLDEMIRQSRSKEGYCYALRGFSTCWDTVLATWVIRVIEREIHRPSTLSDLMSYLAEHDAAAALHAWEKLRRRHRRRSEPAAFVAATAALAGFHLFTFWDHLWPELVRSEGYAREVLLSLDRHEQRHFLKGAANVPSSQLAELYLYLLKLFPKRGDIPMPSGQACWVTPRMEIARLRDELPAILAASGTSEAVVELERIARRVPAEQALWIRWRKQDALIAMRRASWRAPAPDAVLTLIERSERRWIQDEDDLMSLVLESLGRLETNLREGPNSLRDWFWGKATASKIKSRLRPVGEVAMSKIVAQWLEMDLDKSKGRSVLRELQIQHDKRTDIEVSAVAIGANVQVQRPIQVVIEVKGFWHPKIKTAHRDQLVGDYLRGCGRTHGIYLVIWTKSKGDLRKSKLKATTLVDAKKELDALVELYDGKRAPEFVRAVVLDARVG